MKTLFSIIVIISIFFYIADTSIQLKPFKVTFNSLFAALAWVLFVLSFIFMTYNIHSKAYKSGYEKGFQYGKDIAIEALKEVVNDNKNKK